MWIRCKEAGTKERYEVVGLFTEEKDVPYINFSKGFPLRCGIVKKGKQRHFMKFVLLDECKEGDLGRAKAAFQKEMKFKVRYPYVVHVEYAGHFQLDVSDADFGNPELAPFAQTLTNLQQEDGGYAAYCLLEEYVEGKRLNDVYSDQQEPVPEEIMFRHMYQLINGMCAYYKKNLKDPLIHRDIKPANVMISPELSRVTYIDFDISHSSGSKGTIERGGHGNGTPGYAHPRQTEQDAGASDIQSDLYGLGMTFLYMLLGKDYMAYVCQLSEEEMNQWIYATRAQYAPLLYRVKRNQIIRNGALCYSEKRYDELFRIINRMIADDNPLEQEHINYRDPMELETEFLAYLRSYYGNQTYQKLFHEDCLLSGEYEDAGDSIRVQCFAQDQGSTMICLQDYEVHSLKDAHHREIGILLYENQNLSLYLSGSEAKLLGDTYAPANPIILGKQACRFIMYGKEYRLRVISNRRNED